MPHKLPARLLGGVLAFALLASGLTGDACASEASSQRETPLVLAVKNAGPSVVNIQGQKTIRESASTPGRTDSSRQVNGMGTGVVIDSRGYILTNHHVVDGVRQINVTFTDRRKYVAKIVAFDASSDLAVIKIRTSHPLSVIRIGTSRDLMPAESVAAVGNAFGYENTVTVGIISALHRDVQVSETQAYDDLIQTDASINPGNSGGPLLNIDGEMIGVNVAVRAGAQGIGFAIPVDAAMEVAARMMSIEKLENNWHGLTLRAGVAGEPLVIRSVAAGSPAQRSGLQPGDTITRVGQVETERKLDIERGLLGLRGEAAPVEIQRNGERLALELKPARNSRARHIAAKPSSRTRNSRAWEVLGLSLKPEPRLTFTRSNSKYQGGLRIVDVRSGSPAAREGIVTGDILVGMHRWQTASLTDVDYIIDRQDIAQLGEIRFYIYRDNETLFTDINVARRGTSSRRK